MAASSAHTHAWSVQTRLEPGESTITLHISGRLGTEGAREVAGAIGAAISGGGRVHVDLSGVDYISSAGLAVLREAAATLRASGGTLTVVSASEVVGMALRLSGDAGELTT